MSEPQTPFEAACGELESATELTNLESRGTVRLALKRAGLEPKTATVREMCKVIELILPEELAARAIPAEPACARMLTCLENLPTSVSSSSSPAEIFRHLGQDDLH